MPPLEGNEFLAGLGIPHSHRSVVRSAGQTLGIPAERYAGPPALENKEFLAGLRIPHFHQTGNLRGGAPRALTAGQVFAIGAEGQAPDRVGVPLKGQDLLRGVRIPNLHALVAQSASQATEVRTYSDMVPFEVDG